MVDPVRQAAPPPPSAAASRARPEDVAAPYVSGWNPPTATLAQAPAPAEEKGFWGNLGSAITSGDVRAVASTVRSGIGDATEAARGGITSAVNFSGETVGKVADFARSNITGDDIFSQGLRGAINHVEGTTRFNIGVVGGVLREGTSLVGTVGQLGTTLLEAQISPEARMELGGKVIGAVGTAADATGKYLSSVVDNPGRLGGDLQGAWNATSGFVGQTADRYAAAAADGRFEEIGIDVGAVATYVVPVGGGPARALLGGAARTTTEGVVRGGTTLAARDVVSSVVREATPGVTRTAANDVGAIVARTPANDVGPVLGRAVGDGVPARPITEGAPQLRPAAEPALRPPVDPQVLHARAQMAEFVYGRGALPAGTRQVTDAAELAKLNLEPRMLDRGAFHAEVYASGAQGAETYTVAFRGSGPRAGDWVSNGQQSFGIPSNHYAQSLEIGKSIARLDPSIKVDFVGHSLGGGLASHAANASGREAITFNAAGLNSRSIEAGRVVAFENGLATGTANNFSVAGEVLTGLQNVLPIPRAFGTSHVLPSIVPEGTSWFAQHGPLGAVNRHMMNWVLASTEHVARTAP